MASPAFAAVASRRARFLLHARVSTPSVALEDIAEGVVCASLCVEASQKANLIFANSQNLIATESSLRPRLGLRPRRAPRRRP
jgi:hypothetical protein